MSCCDPLRLGGGYDADEQVAEGLGRADARRAVLPAAAATDLTETLGALQTHPRDDRRVKAALANAPIQLRQFDADRIEQRWLASVMA